MSDFFCMHLQITAGVYSGKTGVVHVVFASAQLAVWNRFGLGSLRLVEAMIILLGGCSTKLSMMRAIRACLCEP